MPKFWRGTEARLRALNTQLKTRMGLPRASRCVGVPGAPFGPPSTEALLVVRTVAGDFEARIPDEIETGKDGVPAHDATQSNAPERQVTD